MRVRFEKWNLELSKQFIVVFMMPMVKRDNVQDEHGTAYTLTFHQKPRNYYDHWPQLNKISFLVKWLNLERHHVVAVVPTHLDELRQHEQQDQKLAILNLYQDQGHPDGEIELVLRQIKE